MSLIGALNIGKSALAAHQAAIQVTGNNVANAGNPDYTRQVAGIQTAGEQQVRPGVYIGTGVTLSSISRQIDDALNNRLRNATSDSEAANVRQEWLGRIETTFNELGDADLSTQLSKFFNSWSALANKPQDLSLRQIVLQNGTTLADSFKSMRTNIGSIGSDLDSRIASLAKDADSLAQQVADLNGKVAVAEGGSTGAANGLRDQRDAVLKKLSQLIDVKTVDTGDGMVSVMVGNEPLVSGTTNRGLKVVQSNDPNAVGGTASLIISQDGAEIPSAGGQIGGLSQLHADLNDVTSQIDTLAGAVIYDLNRIHSSGQGLEGLTQVTAGNAVADTTVALADAKSALAFKPQNGSFVVHVKQKSSGLVTSTLVQVDLDGLGGNDTSLDSLKTSLDAVDGINASIIGGRLKINADSNDLEFSFSQDSSGALASLGVGGFFTGKDARDMTVSADLKARPALLAAAKNGQTGDNQAALAIAAMQTTPSSILGGLSLNDAYASMINGVAVKSAASKTNSEAAQAAMDTLSTQREALSGVSLDEEAINLIQEQRAFQGAARLITAVDEMMKTIIQMV